MEKFQINTVMDVDKASGMPIREKMSKLILYRSGDNKKQLGQVDLDLAGFRYNEMQKYQLELEVVDDLDGVIKTDSQCLVEVGLKGSKADGLVAQRMN